MKAKQFKTGVKIHQSYNPSDYSKQEWVNLFKGEYHPRLRVERPNEVPYSDTPNIQIWTTAMGYTESKCHAIVFGETDEKAKANAFLYANAAELLKSVQLILHQAERIGRRHDTYNTMARIVLGRIIRQCRDE